MTARIDALALAGGRFGKIDVACPFCGPSCKSAINRKRKVLRIWRYDPGFATFNCARCGEHGYARDDGITSKADADTLARRAAAERREADDLNRRQYRALDIFYDEAMPITGTLDERYLIKRGIDPDQLPNDMADVLRWHPRCPWERSYAPCLLALWTDVITGEPKANATTIDGIAFTEVGAVATGPMGLFDPSTTSLSGTRWLGSGSLIALSDGRYGMFFGAGNCLDNDSDGFHYIGYAETKNVVNSPADLLNWNVLNQLDNPILSTDTVTDPTGPRPYPQTPPVVNVSGVDALTPAQVAPFTPPPGPNPPPGGYNSNFFSGRVYDPQAIYTNDHTLTIVFAGYNTPQPSNNLGDYRTIGRFQLQVTPGYFKRPQ